MDCLSTAVVDITTLTATYRALDRVPSSGKLGMRHKLRRKLRAELKRGLEAYVDAMARSKHGVLDDRRLASCRMAAEAHMPRALRHQRALKDLMESAPNCLLGFAAARQDLWRLATMVLHLREGVTALTSGGDADRQAIKKLGAQVRDKLTRALIRYALVRQGDSDSSNNDDQLVITARRAALRRIGPRGNAAAKSLGQLEAGIGSTHTLIGMGVVKPLEDLVLDWDSMERQTHAVL
ncbi:MAG TPA: hypothetical protein VIV84_01980 [Burkholderiaceae bacterium]